LQLSDHVYLFHGAGEAGIGIADLISSAIVQETGCTLEEARKHCWFVDSKGLITSDRLGQGHLEHHKIPYAHDKSLLKSHQCVEGKGLWEAVQSVQPTALIGVSAQGGAFTEQIVQYMADINEKPVVFALSNPTSKAECTAEQAYKWTNGRAVFASGSPFDPVTLPDGTHFVPGQGNNA
jgi:malate dehydrogenase (oxaloacetate-decarboxylating)(NADP+)